MQTLARHLRENALVLGLVTLAVITFLAGGESGRLREGAKTASPALAGAALVRFIDTVKERGAERDKERARQEQLSEMVRRDLDETRKVLFTALYAAPYADPGAKVRLAGSLTNAIGYHSRLRPPSEAHQLGLRFVGGAATVVPELEALVNEVDRRLQESERGVPAAFPHRSTDQLKR